ncbi:hypothetical protein GCM10009850_088300 [Nonomuraea monospora]|uniref:Uncharacterized protein n=1 Tax=Nonomuraea monospora TaxID=568818 RepID=A0ABN3CVI9_9ACTN
MRPEESGCLAPHLGSPFAGYRHIDWFGPACWATADIRVRRFTCSCQRVSYEFGQAGGCYAIQRTIKAADGLIIERTALMRLSEADRLWADIFSGAAR